MINVKSLSSLPAKEAHRLVANAAGERGHEAFFRFKGRQACIAKAQAKPLPGAAEGAFIHGAIKAGGHTVNRVVPIYITVLQALKSPLLGMVENAMTKKESKFDFRDEQQFEICHVFTAEPKLLRAMMKTEGVEAIRKQSESVVGEWSAAEINFVMLAVFEQMKRHVETTVKFAADMERDGQVTFFRDTPLAQTSTPAGLDGSSST